ncbi:FtsX-like permease family protein [Puteibacter caeruleilacunae]|nr:FtsX-like permease family protein [Puteibacter caeruleilacunae]
MLNTEIKLIIRNLRRNKVVSSINILGLTIGLTFVILSGRYVYTEMTYDRFHEDYNTISRIERSDKTVPYNPNVLYTWLNDNIPELQYSTRIINDRGTHILSGDDKFNIKKALIIDPDFFDIFSFKLVSGENRSFSKDKSSVILSESLAYKIFGNNNALGQYIIYKGRPLTVKGVINDPPSNSSLKFDLLIPSSNLPGYVDNNWGNNTLQIFVKTKKDIQRAELQKKINTGVISVIKSLNYEWANNIQYSLNPLHKIYHTVNQYDNVCIHGDRKYTFLLLSLSVLVLIIALINYANSLVANASQCLKGIGIKSVTGASKNNNIRHLVIQSTFPCLVATIIAVVVSVLVVTYFEQTLAITLAKITFTQIVLIIIGGATFGAVVGIYPAITLTSVKISDSLKEVNKGGRKVIHFKSYLSIIQFAASIALIICLFTINKQVNYVFKQSAVNFDEDIVLYMPLTNISQHKSPNINTIVESLKKLPEVRDASTCNHLPGDKFYSDLRGLSLTYNDMEKSIDVNHNWVGVEFPEVMGYSIVKGRQFDQALSSDNKSYIVNETFIKEHGIHDISKAFLNGFPIVGVLKDFHYNSLQKKIQPLAIQYIDHYQRRIVVRLASSHLGSLTGVVDKMDETINGIDKTAISDIQFLEQHVAALYEKEVKTSKIILVLSVFSILISCMGLFSMSLFITNRKTKEIGIRKVNGAKITEILAMLNKDFIKWVAIAFIVACPIAYYTMTKWLENFAYKTELSWWIFALAGILALGIALLTVSWQSWSAATKNPVEALRYE